MNCLPVGTTRRRAGPFGLPVPAAVLLAALLVLSPESRFIAAQEPSEDAAAEARPAEDESGQPDAAAEETGESETTAIPSDPVGMLGALAYFAIPFVLASVIAVWFVIERLVVLRRGRVIPRPFVERFLEHLKGGKLDAEKALNLCEQNGSPVATIFAHGVRKWGKPSVELEQAIIDGGERQVSHLRKHLRVLNGVATVTPLIGLLGTVIGMIMSFNDIASASAMGNPQELAHGIAMALLTTAAGLMIAIPTLIMYMYLAGRVDALVMEMDLLAQDVVNLISAEALSNKPVAASRATGRRGSGRSTPSETQQKRAV